MAWDMAKVVGHNARERRQELGLDAAGFGAKMEDALGKPWKRQTISAMENGDRAMTANDLIAISHVLGVTPANLLVPPIEAGDIEIGNLVLKRSDLMHGVRSQESAELLLSLMDEIRDAWEAVGHAQQSLERNARVPLRDMDARITDIVSRL
jgi:transcriptional regulator with XRE-family HTH domain